MTVENGTLSVSYMGNGSQTAFPITFEFILPAQVRVSRIVGGTATLLQLGIHYSISGATVTMFTPPPSGSTLKLQRATTIRQMTDLRQQGQYHPETLERMADLLTMICQELAAGVVDGADIVGVGEVNTGENVNDAGVGVYEGKSGTVLQFRGVAAGSSKISVTHDTATESIKVDLGTVKPEDVGAAPASLVGTVNDHETRLKAVEPRRPVSARGYYVWDGSKYVRTSSYDPSSILPAAATASSVGVVDINFLIALPNADYRVTALTSTTTADKPARVCWRHAKSNTKLTLLLTTGPEDVPTHVYAFTVCVDWAEA